jgi:hypothetical protein
MKFIVVLALLCGVAQARPGGGHSFHSSSHSYHSSGHSYSGGHYSGGHYHSGIGDPTGAIVLLLLVVFIVLLFAVIRGVVARDHVITTGRVSPVAAAPQLRRDLDNLRADDPDFSRPVFEDFAYRLYADARRHGGAHLARYFAPGVQDKLTEHADQVVIGAMRIAGARAVAGENQLVVQFEANLATGNRTRYVVERWYFYRARGVKTKPAKTQAWPCPNCGAPWDGADPQKCAHCGEAIQPGRFDWAVSDVAVESSESVGKTLTGTVPEVGTDYPTITAPTARSLATAINADDPQVTFAAMQARIGLIYDRLDAAWNKSDLTDVRGLVTRSLHDYLRYWLDEYRTQGLANHLEGARIERIDLAKVERDRWFDAVTVRVFATGRDFTVRGDKVVGGSRDKDRRYSEYWTLLRSSARRGPVVAEPKCPNCGAPLQISDAGACEHCGAELENGSFDWVLSKIEQDEVYAG